MATEQKSLFNGPIERVWNTFLEERAAFMRRELSGEVLQRRLAVPPKLTDTRKRALAVFIGLHSEVTATRAVVGLWHRQSRHDDAVLATTIELLWRWGDDWIEKLENFGHDAIEGRRIKAERAEAQKVRARERAEAEARMSPEERAKRARELDALDVEWAKGEQERAARTNVVPLRRAGGQ